MAINRLLQLSNCLTILTFYSLLIENIKSQQYLGQGAFIRFFLFHESK